MEENEAQQRRVFSFNAAVFSQGLHPSQENPRTRGSTKWKHLWQFHRKKKKDLGKSPSAKHLLPSWILILGLLSVCRTMLQVECSTEVEIFVHHIWSQRVLEK